MFFPKIDLMKVFYEANQNGGAGSGSAAGSQGESESNEQPQSQQGDPETFEAWLSAQPVEIQSKAKPLFEAHVSSLQNAVKATRRERDDFQRQIRDLSKKVETGSETQKQLEKLSSSLDEANRKSDFYEGASSHECRNVKAAYAVAVSNDLFTKSGEPDWKAIQAEAPELFGKTQPKINKKTAGSGTDGETPRSGSMNDWIRREAGVFPRSQ